MNARSNLKEAPRDVKRLECLRNPASDKSMSERYDAAVEKENSEWTSLIAAADTAKASKKANGKDNHVSSDNELDTSEESNHEEETVNKKKSKKEKQKQKKLKESPPPPKEDQALLGMEDDVEEGVDWSSDEE